MRSVGVYTGNHLSDLLHGSRPNLVFCNQGTYWRVPVALSSRSHGYIGTVGEIDVDVETGELNIQPNNIKEIKRNAKRLATSVEKPLISKREQIDLVLAASGRVFVPKPVVPSELDVRPAPVLITGQPVSKIAIQQR